MTELDGIPGFYRVSKDEAKLLIQPVIGTDGYYLLRPTDDPRAICTICVTIRQKLMNYKLMRENMTRLFYVRENCKFPTINALVHHYQQYPLNPDVNTRLLFPVKAEQGDEYVALEPARDPPPIVTRTATYSGPAPPLPNRPRPMSGERMRLPLPEPTPTLPPDPRRNRTLPPPGRRDSAHQERNQSSKPEESIETLPGVHVDLPKQHVPVILSAFADRDSSYLVRPSASSKGQFTISLICESSILNFKINCEQTTGLYFVTPRKKYPTVKELLETHRTVPLKSKARQGAKIYLLHPITTQEILQALNTIRQNQPLPSPTSPAPLPPPWKEFFDKNHKRPYYFNPETKQTVWERPKAVESKSKLKKSSTLDTRNGQRQLPNVPEESTFDKPRHSLDSNLPGTRIGLMKSPNRNIDRRGISNLPAKSPSFNKQETTPPFGDTPQSIKPERGLPGLPPKEGSPGPRGSVPKLPPKEIPKDTPLPPLPPKDATPLPPLPEKVPSLPNKEPPPSPLSYNAPPTLPPKDRALSSSLPPLPPKDFSQTTPTISLPPLPPKDLTSSPPNGHTHNGHAHKMRPTEYEDTVFPSPNTQRFMTTAPLPPPMSFNSIPAPPPVPEMGMSTPPLGPGGGPPPPPPIPPEGIPCPPPPPTASPSLNVERRRPKQGPSSPPEPDSSSGGRPFCANDLLLQKNRLKAKKEEDFEPRQKSGSFLENTLSSAIQLRLGSIRSAVDDSDSDDDTDVEEVDDDDEWN